MEILEDLTSQTPSSWGSPDGRPEREPARSQASCTREGCGVLPLLHPHQQADTPDVIHPADNRDTWSQDPRHLGTASDLPLLSPVPIPAGSCPHEVTGAGSALGTLRRWLLTCPFLLLCLCVPTCVCVWRALPYVSVQVSLCVSDSIYVCVCAHVYPCACMRICVYLDMYPCAYVCVYLYVCPWACVYTAVLTRMLE